MNYSEATKYIKQNHWWSEDCPVKWGYCYWMHSAVEQRIEYHADYPKAIFLAVKDGYGQEKSSEEEKLEGYKWLKKQFQSDRSYITDEVVRWHQIQDSVDEVLNEFKNHDAKWTKADLAAMHSKLTSRAIDFVRWGYFIECSDVYNTKILPEVIKQELPELEEKDITNLIITSATPLLVSFMEEYQLELAQTATNHRAELETVHKVADLDKGSNLERAINSFHQQYKWLTVNYGGSPPMTKDDIIKDLKLELEKTDGEIEQAAKDIESKIERLALEQSEMLAKYDISRNLKDDFQLMRELGVSMDERKETMVKTSYVLYQLFEIIAKVNGVKKEEIEWYLIDEVQALLNEDVEVDTKQLSERKKMSVFMTEFDNEDSSTVQVFTGRQAEKLYGLLNSGTSETIKGTVASAPADSKTFTGKAQIVLDITTDTFATGNILVTSMTRPEFVPLMKKAVAIITDEGGVTCHAAVVSREMGIPCIIGTTNATKLITTGQEVTMNLETGDISVATSVNGELNSE